VINNSDNKNSKELDEYFNQLKKLDSWIQSKANEIECWSLSSDSLQIKYELDKIDALSKDYQSISNKLSEIEKYKVQHRIHDPNNFARLNEDYNKLHVSLFLKIEFCLFFL
jgi:hypothetical protein